MTTLVIAEKPSVAKTIAEYLSAKGNGGVSRVDGTHYKVGNFLVANCIGHILENAPPAHYDPIFAESPWRKSAHRLPIIPSEWKLIPKNGKQLSIIRKLLKESNDIIHAGDPDEEGQLLVDEVLIELDNKKPVSRVWLSAMDDTSLNRAFAGIKDNKEYVGWYEHALSRSRADWMFGINMTRITSIYGEGKLPKEEKGPISVGRVQTPTLALIVRREEELQNFSAVNFFVPWIDLSSGPDFRANWKPRDNDARTDHEGRLLDKAGAQAITDGAIQNGKAIVKKFESKDGNENPELPFSLSSLQTLASRKYGYSVSSVLEIMQSLYEKKLTTYPRTDCEYLPESQQVEAAGLLASIKEIGPDINAGALAANVSLKSPAWNDKKVTAHHGIIPLRLADKNAIAALPAQERNLYLEVVKRYIIQFHPAARVRNIAIMLECNSESYGVTGKSYLSRGWRDAFTADAEDEPAKKDKIAEIKLPPALREGDVLGVKGSGLEAQATKPPKRFTEGTLVAAMKNIHQFVSDPAIKKVLRENVGIGTEATRARIITTLFERGYIVTKKKDLIPTPLGIALINALPREITLPDLTAGWQSAMDDIKQRKHVYSDFMSTQAEWLRMLAKATPDLFRDMPVIATSRGAASGGSVSVEIDGHKVGDKCPECAKNNREGLIDSRTVVKDGPNKGKKFLVCSAGREICGFVVYPKNGNTKASVAPREDQPPITIDKHSSGDCCPECKKGELKTRVVSKEGAYKGSIFLGCSDWKSGCHFVVFDKSSKRVVAPRPSR